METDVKEDKELLKLASPVRKHAFARMVSWEFSQPKQPCQSRRKKQRIGSVTADEDVCKDKDDAVALDTDDVCESDEYYTAEEEISSSSEEEVTLENLNISDVQLPKSERQGGRSKSQKRRRKRIYRQKQLDFFAPFADDDSDLIEAVKAEDLNPVKNVPSLMEICLKACSQGNGGPLPILKQHKDELKQRRAFHSLQLKWLHRVLLINEKSFKPWCVSTTENRRSVFREDVDDSPTWTQQVDMLRSLMVKHPLTEKDAPKIAVLAHAIDLMLPSTFKCPAKSSVHPTTDEDKTMMKARQSAVIKVKIALKARYPRFVEHLFDIALAYVWWARGHLSLASELLFKIADEIKTSTPAAKKSWDEKSYTAYLHKAMYMNDAGLMYAMFGDPVAAAKCYRQAAEVSCSGCPSYAQDLVVLQSLILSAASWDQGFMDRKSAVNSCSAWNAVLASPGDCPLEAVYAAVEAFLCFHAGYSTDSTRLSREDENMAWLLEAKAKLEKLMKTFPDASYLKLHHSFVSAVLGHASDSVQSLRLFTACCSPITFPRGFPSRQILNSTKASVFQPLIKTVQETQKPIPVMSLLWRRQLVHPTISKASVDKLADRHGAPLNLHITDEGYLTGDMYLDLPPMRAVLLDPYNGSLCIPHTPSVSHPWRSLTDSSEKCYNADLPIPIEIYKDATRHVTVDMVSMTHSTKDRFATQSLYLQWRDPQRTYKLNLRNIVKKVMKEKIVKHAKKESESEDTSFFKLKTQHLSYFEEKLKKLEEHYQRGWAFHYSHIFGMSKPCSCGEKEPKQKRNMYSVTMFNISIQNVVRYGPASVLLMLNAEKTTSAKNGADTLVFLDMPSSEAFSNPVVHYFGVYSNHLFNQQTLPETYNLDPKHQEVSVIGLTRQDGKENQLWMHTYDEHGQLLDKMRVKDLSKDQPKRITHGNASQLYGLSLENEDDDENAMSKVTVYDMKTKRHWKSVDLFRAEQVVAGYNTIFIRTETALVVLDTSTLLSVDVTFERGSGPSETTGLWLNRSLANIDILASKKITRISACKEEVELYRMVFTADNRVYLLDRPCINSDEAPGPLNVVTEVEIAGRATEAHYISEQVGFIVSVTLNEDEDGHYREYLYWYSNQGQLRGVLPFLGRGSHSLFSVHLPGDGNEADTEGWYLYFTDGYGAICAVKLL